MLFGRRLELVRGRHRGVVAVRGVGRDLVARERHQPVLLDDLRADRHEARVDDLDDVDVARRGTAAVAAAPTLRASSYVGRSENPLNAASMRYSR